MPIQVRALLPSEHEPACTFLRANGWAHRIRNREWFGRLLVTSIAAVAVEEGAIVGFARAVSDGLSNGYLSMVVVAPAHQHKGIGSALVRHVTGDDPNITWVLRAGRPGAREFFARLGFEASSQAMERRRAAAEES